MKPAARRKARGLAVQAIYSWQLSQNHVTDIEQQMLLDNDVAKVDVQYFQELIRGVAAHYKEIDVALMPYTERPFEEVDQIEKAILRLTAFELKYRVDVPYKVAINEGIELAKKFGADDSHRFVNGVLDKAVKDLRVPLL
ncbi:transcription antitermination factor NusB [Psychrosphaera sp. F3M07]|jgi:N utilization substance protein B|uniref:Transcription antitermination protein NusB n=1 Tax=Psychrosphaera aquimarina TaxID=2044854 RepID=A0ABU3QZB7_9GAMM|nr:MULTISPECIES: transcription antitermination factor NusB [Psychrosphaera]MBU2917410.1 transcription antitermination factor NusB [Psychrosphaera sp. F3M07]MDU0112759.1 transcription antitermination factor NusB [Psychrosphaera aquimarina]